MVYAHGVGGAQDLPIPAAYAIAGAGAALTVSFLVLMLAWRRPRYNAATNGRPLPKRLASAIDSPRTATALRVFGLVVFAYIAWAALLGPDLLINPTFGVVYVWLGSGSCPPPCCSGPRSRRSAPHAPSPRC